MKKNQQSMEKQTESEQSCSEQNSNRQISSTPPRRGAETRLVWKTPSGALVTYTHACPVSVVRGHGGHNSIYLVADEATPVYDLEPLEEAKRLVIIGATKAQRFAEMQRRPMHRSRSSSGTEIVS